MSSTEFSLADCVYVVLKYSTVLVRGTYKVSILDTLPDHSEVVLEFSTVLGDRSTVLGNRSQYSTVQYWYSVQEWLLLDNCCAMDNRNWITATG